MPALGRPLLLLLALVLGSTVHAAIELSDDLGNIVTLKKPAQRIISLAPHATELLFAAGAGTQIVGASSFSDYPPEARHIPSIGGYENLDIERILALQPDLVIAWHSGNGPRTLARLRELGLNVYASELTGLEDIPRSLEQFGILSGKHEIAHVEAAKLRARLKKMRRQYQTQDTLSVFYQIWHQPLMTIGSTHIINEVIQLCGGHNIFADQHSLALSISEETVLLRNPQVIIASGMGEPRPEWVENWRRWPQLEAVAKGQLFFIHPDLLQRPSPRLLDGAEQLCSALQQARESTMR
jgi:iron complex transport system substrate-binding protein